MVAEFIIKFRPNGHWPTGVSKEGVLLNPMTDEPKTFHSTIEAGRYGDLSFRIPDPTGHKGRAFAIFDVIRSK